MARTDFTTYFGTAIQGMWIKWSQDNTGGTTDDTLVMDITLNLFNVEMLSTFITGTETGCIDSSNSGHAYLVFFLNFMNNTQDSSTQSVGLDDLTYDKFVGILDFTSSPWTVTTYDLTGTMGTDFPELKYTCLSSVSARAGSTTLTYDSDWFIDEDGIE